jgi:chaperone modulatory protein CbpM
METELITINDYCTHYAVPKTFIEALEDSGLVVLTTKNGQKYLHYEQLVEMDRFIHFHYDLQINIEGIDAIMNLLQKVKQMQSEISKLKNHVYVQEHFPDFRHQVKH